MESIFLRLFNISVAASWLVLAVIALRMIFKKAPKFLRCIMWALVGLRLIFPFSIKSIVSLVPSAEPLPPKMLYSNTPAIESGISMLNSIVNPLIAEPLSPAAHESVNPMQILTAIAFAVWAFGMLVMLIYAFVSYFRIRKKVSNAIQRTQNIWVCDNISTPFILGVFRPRIFLPSSLEESDEKYVIAHENAHIKRRDHWWKPFAFVLLAVYWWNPLLWLSYILLCRDIELACDEKIVKEMGDGIKKPYSKALINCSVPRKTIAACPLAFGEVSIKGRIKSVLSYKKPAFWITAAATAACIAAVVCFFTCPKENVQPLLYNSLSSITDSGHEGVIYEFVDFAVTKEFSYIEIKWRNQTGVSICFNDGFSFYKEGKKIVPLKMTIQKDILNIVKPSETQPEVYDISHYGISEKGRYRLEKEFYFEDSPEKTYKAYVEIIIDNWYQFTGMQYKSEKIVFEDGSFSSIVYYDDGFLPQFYISADMRLMTNEHPKPTILSSWYDLGGLEKITLSKADFDHLMKSDIIGLGYSAKNLSKNNKNAFYVVNAETGRIYYLLEQKTGEIFIAIGYPKENIIRWVFKMEETHNGVNPEKDILPLKERYPQYFNLSVSKGLELYVWKMSENHYLCGLLKGKNLEYTNEDILSLAPVSVDDMKTILSSYNITDSDIAVIPIHHPLSSYLGKIDDNEIAKTRKMFGLKAADDTAGGNTNQYSHTIPDTFKVNQAVVMEVKDGCVIVERTQNGYIHCNDSKYSTFKRFAFKTANADEFKAKDIVSIAHTGDFLEGDPPVGTAYGIYKID